MSELDDPLRSDRSTASTVDGGEPIKDAEILIVGDPVDGFAYYGPTPSQDPDGYQQARTRRLDETGQDWWTVPLKPLSALPPIAPDPQPDPDPVLGPAPQGARDRPGGLPDGVYYLTTRLAGRPGSETHFAVIGTELLEVVDHLADGSPDWSTASICDPCRGDTDFYHPAWALLRYYNHDLRPQDVWPAATRRRRDRELARYTAAGLIAGWQPHPTSGGYAVQVHGPNGTEELVLRTPDHVHAFVTALASVMQSGLVRRRDPDPATVRAYAEDIVEMIRVDVPAGQVPTSVRDFGDLHAFVDANEYLIHAGQAHDGSRESTDEINAIQDLVSQYIAEGRLLTDHGQPLPDRDLAAPHAEVFPPVSDMAHGAATTDGSSGTSTPPQ